MDQPAQLPSDSQAAIAPAKRSAAPPWGILIALLALLAVGWNWWDTHQQVRILQDQLANRLADADDRLRKTQGIADQSKQSVQQLQSTLAVVENKLAESQNQQVALEALYQELSHSRDEWSLTEIEQILGIANQQLQLAGNVQAALIALQSADARLQRFDKPQLAGLRRAIDLDIQRLKAVPGVDTVGIAVKLDNLVLAADVIPLHFESPPSAETEDRPEKPIPVSSIGRLGDRIWQELKSVIRIQKLDAVAPPLLAPNHAYFLRENLKLRLLSARVALLARDETSYRADLQAARDWLKRYFAIKAKSVRNMEATLKQLMDNDISISVPDMRASLEAVRNYRSLGEKATQ